MTNIAPYNPPTFEEEPLTEEAYTAIKAALAVDRRPYAYGYLLLTKVLRNTGLRQAEVLRMGTEHVMEDGPRVLMLIQRVKKRKPVWERIPLHPELGAELLAYIRGQGLIPGRPIWPFKARIYQRVFRAASEAALGLVHTPHSLRHLYTKTLIDEGVPVVVTAALLGHEDERTTIASLLRERGYATAVFGKWHLGMQIPGTRGDRDWSAPVLDGPLQKGFDTFYGLPASMNFGVLTWFADDRATAPATLWTRKKFPASEITTAPLDYRMAPPYDDERQTEQDIEVAPGFADVDALRIITEHAVDYIETHAGDPFFLYVAFTSPHLPHCTAPEFRGTSGMGNYGDFLAETDHRVGQILEVLDRCGLTRDTLVVLTSDNGPENNYKDWERLYGHESAGGFRGGKRDVYEGGHRVPFLVRWPRVVAARRTCDELIGQVDLLATIAEIVGSDLEPGNGEDSFSFLPVLRDERLPRPLRGPLIHHGREQFAIRDGPWKLILGRNPDDRSAPGPPAELFHLETDPRETTNVLGDHPGVVEKLRRRADELVLGLPAHRGAGVRWER